MEPSVAPVISGSYLTVGNDTTLLYTGVLDVFGSKVPTECRFDFRAGSILSADYIALPKADGSGDSQYYMKWNNGSFAFLF